MQKISLFTSTDHLAADVWIPMFKIMPEAITWGTRIFLKERDGVYREGFTVAGFTKEEFARRGMEFEEEEDFFEGLEPPKGRPPGKDRKYG